VASRGAEIAHSCGFAAEPGGELAGRTWEGIVNVADELDAAVIVIGSRGLSGLQEILARASRTRLRHMQGGRC
jgi:nucleotide-binding universal stress UspA family protein